MLSRVNTIIRPFYLYAIFSLLILTLSRIFLASWQVDRVISIDNLFQLLFNGLRIDLSTIAYLLILPALLHPFMMRSRLFSQWHSVLKVWFLLASCTLLFFELSTPAFITEYDLRPNRLFVEYLIYPKEVASMLLSGHLTEITCSFLGLIFGGVVTWKIINRFIIVTPQRSQSSYFLTIITFLFLVICLLMSARGTVTHRPLNPALVYFSTDPLLNSLTLNSAYSVAFAVKQMVNEKNAAKIYGNMTREKIVQLIREETGLPNSAFINDDLPSMSVKPPINQLAQNIKPKNLVIVLEESLGAQFVGSLGGSGLTPELDKLMTQGWAFEQLYATGTRSVRGIEAVITGFTPTPARSVVKLDKSQHGFFTIASLLAQHKYNTQFVYGGESHFDNMKSFFLGNGFNSIIDFDDIESPEFVGSWGASDEDLFTQANKELKKLHQQEKPFFSLIFSSSNHDPFEIPAGKITEQPQDSPRDKAIRYADYALGKFIRNAKEEAYWKDTIFLVVADHDARAFGAELVPIKSFHIPGVILNSGKANKLDTRMVSHIDLAPTLLSLMGISDATPMLGYDLNKPQKQERTMMQFAQNFAYMVDKKVAILQPNKPVSYFDYDLNTKKLTPAEDDIQLGEKALAHALFGSMAYNKALFTLSPKEIDLVSTSKP